jgi:hypothetical protein
MTANEIASTMRNLASAVEKVEGLSELWHSDALQPEAAIGAAGFLCYLRDCLTVSGKDVWTREELLVLLETMSRDPEVFPGGIAILMWQEE